MTFDDDTKDEEFGGSLSDDALDGLGDDDASDDEDSSAGGGFDDFGGSTDEEM